MVELDFEGQNVLPSGLQNSAQIRPLDRRLYLWYNSGHQITQRGASKETQGGHTFSPHHFRGRSRAVEVSAILTPWTIFLGEVNYLPGKTICLYGDSGSGKSTQAGELAKYVYKTKKKKTVLNTADRGGYDSISALVRREIIIVNELGPDDNPWIWIDNAAKGSADPEVGCLVFDSGTSMAEALLSACAKSEFQIGQAKTQKFSVTQEKGKQNLTVSATNMPHYGIVQTFMLDAIWASSWHIRKDIDVLWTFAVHRDEEEDRTPILGPKLAGKALTAAIPKWFRYTFRLASIPSEGQEPVHRIYLSEYPELAGLGHGFGNSRMPLGVDPLPPYLEGRECSLPKVFDLMEVAQKQADDRLDEELGLI